MFTVQIIPKFLPFFTKVDFLGEHAYLFNSEVIVSQ